MDKTLKATIAALGGEGVNAGVSPASEEGVNTVVSPATETSPAVESGNVTEVETTGTEKTGVEEVAAEPNHRSAEARIRELNEEKKAAESRIVEYEAQLQQFQQVQPLMEVLQGNPEITKQLIDLAYGRQEQPAAPTLEDYVAHYMQDADTDDPLSVQVAELRAEAHYDRDMRAAEQQRQQEQSRAAQEQVQQEQAKQYWTGIYNDVTTAVKTAELPNNPLIASGVMALFQQNRGQKPVADCVTEIKAMFENYHSAKMAQYAKQKQMPQQVIQGGGGAAPVALPKKPEEMTIAEQTAYTEAFLKANSG